MLRRWLTDRKIRTQVKQKFHYRDILEVVRKREEFRYKLNEISKHSNNGDTEKLKSFITALSWVINDLKNSKDTTSGI